MLRTQSLKQCISLLGTMALTAAALTTATLADGGPPRAARAAPAAPPPAVLSWTGFYGGVNVGAGFTDSSSASWVPADNLAAAFLAACPVGACNRTLSPHDSTGVIGGLQMGYNWQTGNVVLGFEADFQGSTAGAHRGIDVRPPGAIFQQDYNANVEWFGTVRGRLGLLAAPNLLAYVTAGFAYGSVAHSYGMNILIAPNTPFSQHTGHSTDINTGWTAGAGMEYALGNGITIGAEYLYIDLGKGESFGTPQQSGTCSAFALAALCNHTVRPADLDLHVARLKVNYKF